MTVNISRFADYQDDKTPLTTHFEENHDLTVTINRGSNPGSGRGEEWGGTVLVRLNVDDEDYAVVEVQAERAEGRDSLHTVQRALAHLTAVRDRLRAFAAIEDAS